MKKKLVTKIIEADIISSHQSVILKDTKPVPELHGDQSGFWPPPTPCKLFYMYVYVHKYYSLAIFHVD